MRLFYWYSPFNPFCISSKVISAYILAVVAGDAWPNCFWTCRRFPVFRNSATAIVCRAEWIDLPFMLTLTNHHEQLRNAKRSDVTKTAFIAQEHPLQHVFHNHRICGPACANYDVLTGNSHEYGPRSPREGYDTRPRMGLPGRLARPN